MHWSRNLPEVGKPILDIAARIEAIQAQIAKLEDDLEYYEGVIALDIEKQWDEQDIAKAKAT